MVTPTYAQYFVPNDKCSNEDETNGDNENNSGYHSDRFGHLHKGADQHDHIMVGKSTTNQFQLPEKLDTTSDQYSTIFKYGQAYPNHET
jgi:hypothetical protein